MGELATRIRAKYPGSYDTLSDADLESKVMAKYPGVYDHLADGGGKYKAVTGNMNPTAEESEAFRKKMVQETGTTLQKAKEYIPSRQTLANIARPTLEAGGAVLGGLAGGAGGAAAGLGVGSIPGAAVGGVAGAGLGYAMGKNIADNIEGTAGGTAGEVASRTLKDVATGVAYEMGGQAVVPALSMVAKGTGAVAKPLLGKLSGVGPGAIDEAIKSGQQSTSANPLKSQTAFDKALRGKISGEEIVDNARGALNTLKEQRATAYQAQLQTIASNTAPIDMRPFKQETLALMNKYNVKANVVTNAKGQPQLQIDTSRIAMGKSGRNDIEEIIHTIAEWGTKPGDNTAAGLDVLKRQLDDFYSDSSQARQFVTALRNKVKDTIIANVPQYDEMTKGYSEATKLIKDVEADLMMRKQGMSGRITADKTLRRLMSAMRDNFEMRRELVEILGNKGGEDLSGQIAGYTMNTAIPRGLAGTGPVLAGQAAYAHFVNPSFWPVLAASSPRVQGEFLRVFGRAMKGAQKAAPMAKPAAITAATMADNE